MTDEDNKSNSDEAQNAPIKLNVTKGPPHKVEKTPALEPGLIVGYASQHSHTIYSTKHSDLAGKRESR
jgi:hypothetical protein